MKYHVCVSSTARFQHFLYGDFGEESRPHSHLYTCEWRLYADRLGANGFVADISRMRLALKEVLDPLHSVLLNDLPEFRTVQTSVEEVACWLVRRLWHTLQRTGEDLSRVTAAEVRLYEDPNTWASVVLTTEELG